MWRYYNPNPEHNDTGDCVIRALSLAFGTDWETTFLNVAMKGYEMHKMPSNNAVWDAYLRHNGFKRYILPNDCPDCYRIKNFCMDNPTGVYILATGSHVVTVIDGNYYDTWDSGNEVAIYFYKKEK